MSVLIPQDEEDEVARGAVAEAGEAAVGAVVGEGAVEAFELNGTAHLTTNNGKRDRMARRRQTNDGRVSAFTGQSHTGGSPMALLSNAMVPRDTDTCQREDHPKQPRGWLAGSQHRFETPTSVTLGISGPMSGLCVTSQSEKATSRPQTAETLS